MFSIEFLGSSIVDDRSHLPLGRIVAGDLSEEFSVTVDEWDESDYKSSWVQELTSLVKGADKAVLLTLAMDPTHANWLRGYVLYRFGREAWIQERLFIMDELQSPFDLSDPSSSLGGHESVNEDGREISQWRVSMLDIERFLDQEC